MLDVSAVTMVFFECSSTCAIWSWWTSPWGGALRGTHQPKESRWPLQRGQARHPGGKPKWNLKSGWQQEKKKQPTTEDLIKAAKHHFLLRDVRSNWDKKNIFSSRSPRFFSFKMHRNEEERPKAVLPVLQPQAARRTYLWNTSEPWNLLQILFNLFRIVVTLLPNSWKGFDGSIFFRMKRCDSWDACEVKRRSQEGFLKDQLREAGQARMVGPNFLNFNMDRPKMKKLKGHKRA